MMKVVLNTAADIEKQLSIIEESLLFQAISRKTDITDDEYHRLVDQLIKEGVLYSPKPDHLKLTGSVSKDLS